MILSTEAYEIFSQINPEFTKLGDLKKIAKEIKKTMTWQWSCDQLKNIFTDF